MMKTSVFVSCCLAALTAPSSSFTPFPTNTAKTTTTTTTTLFIKKNYIDKSQIPKSGEGNIFDTNFSGGYFEKESADVEAIKIASKIRSVKDLGWTNPTPKRKGNTRPRHRAWGGEGERPVQLKSNYDESNANCVEKWLSLEDLYANTKSSGSAADAVFVALAGGAKYAERDVCEATIESWKDTNGKFSDQAFLKSVKKGRSDLATGWASFVGTNLFFVSCILFPNNPASKVLEGVIGIARDQVLSPFP
uniref:Uncharacterized protein n=1 Tax=Ditylum brightwellii TaxID=49249 RepID=A0A7S2ER15_9STRA|mmetsp:Transcript_40719/g.60998  ORF Transcript_40719/g.60998 Transcript_40719/m.60998 type:complete len:249 (+) Transcript_40719:97-843(+)